MPARYDRLHQLQLHGIRTHHRAPELERALRLHPDWPVCRCGWPVDPAAGTTHPTCQETPHAA